VRVSLILAASIMAAGTALAVVPTKASAAVDAFLYIDGVKGESTDARHKDWIEVSDFSFGAGNSTSIGSAASGAGVGKAAVHSIRIVKTIDSASPLLRQAGSTGRHFAKATLMMRKAGGEQQAFMTYVLTDVLVSGYSMSSGGDRPQESLTLNFAKMEMSDAGPTSGRAAVMTTALPPPGARQSPPSTNGLPPPGR
jgi:type VI secretion system secreted protein Hcp